MRLPALLVLAVTGALALSAPCAARADVLLVDRMQKEAGIPKPQRGMSMADVERRFGVPQSRLDARGGQKRQWPTIHRWVYPAYVVYFERNKVIDVVLQQASPNEGAPKPPIR